MFVFKQTYHLINVHPGQQFNFTMKALDQGGYPVLANIFVDNLLSNKHRLHPLSQTVNSLCTSVYYRLYSSEEDKSVMFRLIIENPCRNFDDSQDYLVFLSSDVQLDLQYQKVIINVLVTGMSKISLKTASSMTVHLSVSRTPFGFH